MLIGTPSGILAYNNTSLKWFTITTPHFEVHYHQGEEWTAEQVAEVAERIYPSITGLYDYAPKGKVHFVIKDTDDYANGATYYFDNKIEIWATNLEFGFRGTSKWIENVVTHEYTHMVSMQASFKFTKHVPAFYFQLIDFEKEKRPDVLTGYPSNLASYALPGAVIPPWFAEGVAQYQSPERRYDCWDTHRDMILRCAVLEDKMLSYDEMCFFGHTGMGNEEVYDHGYGLVGFIASKYGPESLAGIVKAMRSPLRMTFDSALEKVTGKKGKELYDDWRNEMRAKYEKQARAISADLKRGETAAEGGYMTIGPAWSPDGRKLAYLSNKGSDFSSTALYVLDRESGKAKRLKGGVSSPASFSPDGGKVIYSRKHKVDRFGSEVNDIFEYDFATGKEKQLTKKLRAGSPSYSPRGDMIVCVLNGDGTHRLAVLDAGGENVRVIYSGRKGTQIYSPRFSPDGSRILFGIFEGATRDIAVIPAEGGGIRYLLRSGHDERDAAWKPGGIVFSSDKGGVFNIYELDFADDRVHRLTNLIGGAFMPAVSPSGEELAYASFSADGYSVEVMDLEKGSGGMTLEEYEREAPAAIDRCRFLHAGSLQEPSDASSAGAKAQSAGGSPGAAAGGGEHALGAYEKGKYEREFTPFQVYPRFIIYDRTARFGFFMASNEMLDKQSIYIASSMGTNKEFDAYLSYEMRYLYPTVFAEFLRMREKFKETVSSQDQDKPWEFWDLDIRYDLWLFNFGLRLELEDPYSLTSRNNFSLYFSHGEYSVHIAADVYDKQNKTWSYGGTGSWKYYIGNDITAKWHYKSIARAMDSDINPRGAREIDVQYMRAYDRLFTSGEFEYGFYPKFDRNYFNQYTLDWKEYVALPYLGHTLQLRLFAAAIDKKVNDFFYVYLGGRDYLRGYTYYSIGGRKALLASVTYRFPILRNVNRQFLHLYMRDVYGSVFYEAGNGWKEDKLRTYGYKKTIGGELRFSLGSFYAYPTALSITAAYAMDSFELSNLVFSEKPVEVRKGWTSYVTLGFGF